MKMDKAFHILIVDDDIRIRNLLNKYLIEHNFFVSKVGSIEETYKFLKHIMPDLIILDVMLPGENGIEFTNKMRANLNIPILMLSAMGEAENRIHGLEVGADDYLSKPFEPKELLLRINKLINRNRKNISNVIQINGFTFFDTISGRLTQNEQIVALTSNESSLLRFLIENQGRLLTREELAKFAGSISERSIDVQITRLRNKLEENPKKPFHLQTIRGKGYIFNF